MIYLILIGAIIAMGSQSDKIQETIEEKLDSWTEYDSLFKKYGAEYNIDWRWLKAICLNESNLGKAKSVMIGLENPRDIENSKSSDGKSWGLMQVTVPTAKDFDLAANSEKLNNPDYSVKIASKYLAWVKKQFSAYVNNPNYLEYVIKSYNQGVTNTKKEIAKTSSGFAQGYWDKFQKNLERVKNS